MKTIEESSIRLIPFRLYGIDEISPDEYFHACCLRNDGDITGLKDYITSLGFTITLIHNKDTLNYYKIGKRNVCGLNSIW